MNEFTEGLAVFDLLVLDRNIGHSGYLCNVLLRLYHLFQTTFVVEPGRAFREDEDDNQESWESYQSTDDRRETPFGKDHTDKGHDEAGYSLNLIVVEKRQTNPVEESAKSHSLLWQ